MQCIAINISSTKFYEVLRDSPRETLSQELSRGRNVLHLDLNAIPTVACPSNGIGGAEADLEVRQRQSKEIKRNKSKGQKIARSNKY